MNPPAAPRKFTRITSRSFQQPHTTELLWVSEWLTRYLNWLLAARSGIFTPPEEARDYVALLADPGWPSGMYIYK